MQDIILEKIAKMRAILPLLLPSPKQAIGYGLFVIICFCFFWGLEYMRFHLLPGVKKRIEENTPYALSYSGSSVGLIPPDITLVTLSVADGATGYPVLDLKNVRIKGEFLPLFLGKLRAIISADLYGGMLQADYKSGFFSGFEKSIDSLKLELLDLEKIPQIQEVNDSLKGVVSVILNKAEQTEQSEMFHIKLKARGVAAKNSIVFLEGAWLQQLHIQGEMSLAGSELTVHSLTIKDKDGLDLYLTGQVRLASAIQNSRLHLEARFLAPPRRMNKNLVPESVLNMLEEKQSLPVKLKGTLKTPQFNLSGLQ